MSRPRRNLLTTLYDLFLTDLFRKFTIFSLSDTYEKNRHEITNEFYSGAHARCTLPVDSCPVSRLLTHSFIRSLTPFFRSFIRLLDFHHRPLLLSPWATRPAPAASQRTHTPVSAGQGRAYPLDTIQSRCSGARPAWRGWWWEWG